jgi:cytochrome c-type biogenesis protein CcmH/NrfG
MLYWRLFAGISFLGFALALGGALHPMAIGNARHFEDLAERDPAVAPSALREAVRLNPRDSAAWMALGLATERDGDMEQAAGCFLEAEKVDRQY